MTEYSAKDIKIIQSAEAIRRRPLMFVDDTTSDGFHKLINRLIEAAIDAQPKNRCTSLIIKFHPDRSLSLKDNGLGQPIKPYPTTSTQPLIEALMTQFFAGGAGTNMVEESYLFNLGPIVNALSEWLRLETVTNKMMYKMSCNRGRVTTPLHLVGVSSDKGTKIHFMPDDTIWSDITLNLRILVTNLQQLNLNLSDFTILLCDEQNGSEIKLGGK